MGKGRGRERRVILNAILRVAVVLMREEGLGLGWARGVLGLVDDVLEGATETGENRLGGRVCLRSG